MTEPAFAADVLHRLRHEIEVEIETHPTGGAPPHRTIIWVVVDAKDRVLIRSYRGAMARWYREATSGTPAALVLGAEVLPVTVEHAPDEEGIRACSAELERKYAGDPATPAMVRRNVLDTTLELHPA
ncbi:MAG: DUF2255 family protein [Candidatus Limnocylindria bacterium]